MIYAVYLAIVNKENFVDVAIGEEVGMHTLIEALLFSIVHFDSWKDLACRLECNGYEEFLSMWNMITQCLNHFIFCTFHDVCLAFAYDIIQNNVFATNEHQGVIVHEHTVLAYWILETTKWGFQCYRNSIDYLVGWFGEHLLFDNLFAI